MIRKPRIIWYTDAGTRDNAMKLRVDEQKSKKAGIE